MAIMNDKRVNIEYYKALKDKVCYCPSSGEFEWVVSTNTRIVIGSKAGSVINTGYKAIGFQGKLILCHRLAWFMIYGELPNVIDHVDGDKKNNKISNLRKCTQQQNSFNSSVSKRNRSGFKGVHWHKASGKWVARIGFNRKRISLGSFDCPREASDKYQQKAKELFGEFNKEVVGDK